MLTEVSTNKYWFIWFFLREDAIFVVVFIARLATKVNTHTPFKDDLTAALPRLPEWREGCSATGNNLGQIPQKNK